MQARSRGTSYHNFLITVTSRHHERYGVSDHRQLDFLSNSLFRLTTKKTSKPSLALFGGMEHVKSRLSTASISVGMPLSKCVVNTSVISNPFPQFIHFLPFIFVLCCFVFLRIIETLLMPVIYFYLFISRSYLIRCLNCWYVRTHTTRRCSWSKELFIRIHTIYIQFINIYRSVNSPCVYYSIRIYTDRAPSNALIIIIMASEAPSLLIKEAIQQRHHWF